MVTDLRHNAVVAVDHLAAKSTVPLLREIGELASIEGSGTLFEVRGSHYLVTAAHAAENLSRGDVCIPCGPNKKEVWALGQGRLATIDKYDLAVFRIDEEMSVDRLKKVWQFLTLDHVWLGDIHPSATFLLYGFPVATTTQRGILVDSTPISYVTARYDKTPTGLKYPLEPDVDTFLEHKAEAMDRQTNRLVAVPDLPGISGCSVWAVLDPTTTSSAIWSPDTHARIVAIETSYLRGSWIRCRRWFVVNTMIEELERETG